MFLLVHLRLSSQIFREENTLPVGAVVFCVCVATVNHHSGVVLCHSSPEVVKSLLPFFESVPSSTMIYQPGINISAPRRHDITHYLRGWGGGHVTSTHSIIKRVRRHYTT